MDAIKSIIPGNVDIMIFSETKIDSSYPSTQFMIDGFSKPFRRDRNSNGGGLLIYVREDITSKLVAQHTLPDDIEAIFLEINFRKLKWLLCGTYHPPSQNDEYYFNSIGRALNVYGSKYDRILLAGDFNAEDHEVTISNFLELYNLQNLVKEKTCFKSLNNPTCIDLFLTNCNRSFMHTNVVSTGVSDCHKMILTVLKTTFKKAKPRVISYQNYKQFDERKFLSDLEQRLISEGCIISYGKFNEIFLDLFNLHAPLKRKWFELMKFLI